MAISLIAIGANQQHPLRQIHLACEFIQALPNTYILQRSKIIITAALGYTRQQDYFNQVIKIRSTLQPLALLEHLQAIEARCGRVRRIPWGPRELDLDILCYEKIKFNHPRLTLPHPQIETRPFVKYLMNDLESSNLKFQAL